MQVLFPAAFIVYFRQQNIQVPVHWFLASKWCILMSLNLLFLTQNRIFLFTPVPFEKNSSYVSGVSVCIFVALSVRMCVAGANKDEVTMSWCFGSNEILALRF